MILFKNIFSILFLLICVASMNAWSTMPVGSTLFLWILWSAMFLSFLWAKRIYYNPFNSKSILFINIYLLWLAISVYRGVLISETYWDWKGLIFASFSLSVPFFVYAFTNPILLQHLFKTWIFWALPLFGLLIWIISSDVYGFYLVPVTFFILWFPTTPKKWRWVFVLISLFVLTANLDARSSLVKFSVPVLLLVIYYFRFIIPNVALRMLSLTTYIAPVVAFSFAVTTGFNVFKMDKYVSKDYEYKIGKENYATITADSRTAIYEDVLYSAFKHDYVWQGRTPARGNDMKTFNIDIIKQVTGRNERAKNEIGITNVFTWLGLIGVILFTLIFLKATYLALYQSKNIFVKLLGVYVAFRWAYSWVEDYFGYDIMSFFLWMMIAICYSKQFREMTDREIKIWMKGIFDKRYRKYQNKYLVKPISKEIAA